MEVVDVVKKLIGNIRPVGESNTDRERLVNLKAMCHLVNELIIEIDDVGFEFKDSYEASVKACSEYARKFLSETVEIVK